MKSFEERRKEYFQRLRKYSEYIIQSSKDKKNEKLIELLLMPRTEKELEFCNHYIMFLEDTIKISIHAAQGNVEKINLDNNDFIDYVAKFVNAAYNNADEDELKKLIEPYMANNKKFFAKVIYQMLVLTQSTPEYLAESLCKKCNIDLDDEFQVMQLTVLMNKASAKLQPEIISLNEEELEEFILFTKHFHNFCIKGIIDHSNEEVNEILEELYDEEEPNEGFSRTRNIK